MAHQGHICKHNGKVSLSSCRWVQRSGRKLIGDGIPLVNPLKTNEKSDGFRGIPACIRLKLGRSNNSKYLKFSFPHPQYHVILKRGQHLRELESTIAKTAKHTGVPHARSTIRRVGCLDNSLLLLPLVAPPPLPCLSLYAR